MMNIADKNQNCWTAVLLTLVLFRNGQADQQAAPPATGDEPAAKKADQNDSLPAKEGDQQKPMAAEEQVKALGAAFRLLFQGQAVVVQDNDGGDVAVGFDLVAPADQANPGNDQDENNAVVLQMTQQLRPVLASELGFVRLMCPELTVEQRKKIRDAGNDALKSAAKELAAKQNQQMNGGMLKVNRAKKNSEPRAIICEFLDKILRETVSNEQMDRYEVELRLRKERRKRVAIQQVVALIDFHLLLTQPQRQAIAESISEKWQEDWEKWTRMLQAYGDQYLPTLPEGLVVKHLNADQKSVWNGLQKIDFGWWWNGEQGVDPDEDGWWGGEDRDQKTGAMRVRKGVGILDGILLDSVK